MFKEIIDTLPAEYRSDQWSFRLSGSVLEITVTKDCTFERENYRSAVISSGQVLKALSMQLDKAGRSYHIQTFPSIENPALIGAIRLDEPDSSAVNNTSDGKKEPESQPENNHIRKLADEFHLKMLKITDPELLAGTVNIPNKYSSYFAITSTLDNPFTWIKVGYWIESLQSNNDSGLDYSVNLLNNTTDSRNRLAKRFGLNRSNHLQAVLML